MKHLSFPSIEQFRNVVKSVSDRTYHNGHVRKPVIMFRGTVKSHGTNASIVYDREENVFYAQSRSNVLSLTSDNAGFCQYFETNREFFETWLRNTVSDGERYYSIYGEWCGGNIQKGVAISGLPKMFLIFALRLSNLDEDNNPVSNWYFDNLEVPKNEIGCYSIASFGTYEIAIDFNNPELSQNQLVEWTEGVEEVCPIGKFFGNEGVGEGIVYHPVSADIPNFHLSELFFKVKGEKHSVSKVKTLAAVDVEVINSINELVASLATDNRFNQGIQVLTERGIDVNDSKNTRDFITWVKDDVIKEDRDTILVSGLDFGKVIGNITSMAGKWFNSRPI